MLKVAPYVPPHRRKQPNTDLKSLDEVREIGSREAWGLSKEKDNTNSRTPYTGTQRGNSSENARNKASILSDTTAVGEVRDFVSREALGHLKKKDNTNSRTPYTGTQRGNSSENARNKVSTPSDTERNRRPVTIPFTQSYSESVYNFFEGIRELTFESKITIVTGLNGSGKTLLMRHINGYFIDSPAKKDTTLLIESLANLYEILDISQHKERLIDNRIRQAIIVRAAKTALGLIGELPSGVNKDIAIQIKRLDLAYIDRVVDWAMSTSETVIENKKLREAIGLLGGENAPNIRILKNIILHYYNLKRHKQDFTYKTGSYIPSDVLDIVKSDNSDEDVYWAKNPRNTSIAEPKEIRQFRDEIAEIPDYQIIDLDKPLVFLARVFLAYWHAKKNYCQFQKKLDKVAKIIEALCNEDCRYKSALGDWLALDKDAPWREEALKKSVISQLGDKKNISGLKEFLERLDRISRDKVPNAKRYPLKIYKKFLYENPEDIINKMLDRIGFKYKLKIIPSFDDLIQTQESELPLEFDLENIFLITRTNGNKFSYSRWNKALSSGEILSFISVIWQFALNKLSEGKHRVKTILLDEPDKFFDPVICREFMKILLGIADSGIYIFFTTHRIDTVSLIPNERLETGDVGIYAIQQSKLTGQKEIPRITKMHAMYKLTRNFREFSGHHFRVYCESTDDALFYEGAYASLMNICDNVPIEHITAEREWFMPNTEMKIGRLLSRRYRLAFQSISLEGKYGGGCDKVIDHVRITHNAYADREHIADPSGSTTSLLLHREFHLPYGVIDNDGKGEIGSRISPRISPRIQEANTNVIDMLAKRITIPTARYNLREGVSLDGGRYSLENFLYDPMIFSIALTDPVVYDTANLNSNLTKAINSNGEDFCILSICLLIAETLQKDEIDTNKLNGLIKQYYVVLAELFKENFLKKNDIEFAEKIKTFKTKQSEVENLKNIIIESLISDLSINDERIVKIRNLKEENSENEPKNSGIGAGDCIGKLKSVLGIRKDTISKSLKKILDKKKRNEEDKKNIDQLMVELQNIILSYYSSNLSFGLIENLEKIPVVPDLDKLKSDIYLISLIHEYRAIRTQEKEAQANQNRANDNKNLIEELKKQIHANPMQAYNLGPRKSMVDELRRLESGVSGIRASPQINKVINNFIESFIVNDEVDKKDLRNLSALMQKKCNSEDLFESSKKFLIGFNSAIEEIKDKHQINLENKEVGSGGYAELQTKIQKLQNLIEIVNQEIDNDVGLSLLAIAARQSKLHKVVLHGSYTDRQVLFLYSNQSVTKTMELTYPIELLQIRGHDIEHSVFSTELTGEIVKFISKKGMKHIPLDLAQVFFDLNHKVRSIMNPIVKKYDHRYKAASTSCGATAGEAVTVPMQEVNEIGVANTVSGTNDNPENQKVQRILELKSKLKHINIDIRQFVDGISDTDRGESIIRNWNSETGEVEIRSNGDCLFNSILIAMKIEFPQHEKIRDKNNHLDLRALINPNLYKPAEHADLHDTYKKHVRNFLSEEVATNNLRGYRGKFGDLIKCYNKKYLSAKSADKKEKIVKEFFTKNAINLYIDSIKTTPETWGMEAELQILASALEIKIIVMHNNAERAKYNDAADNAITLNFTGDHYDVILSDVIKRRLNALDTGVEEAKDNNENLRRTEKILLAPDLNLILAKQAIPQHISCTAERELEYNNLCNNIMLQSNNTRSNISGTVSLMPESDHISQHRNNVFKLISQIDSGAITPNTVICLERKQYGDNLGMRDVILLAKIIEYNQNCARISEQVKLPHSIMHSLIYADAKLYLAARAKGISALGIEGKSLPYPKEDPLYNQAREEYMADQINKITATGKNVIFLVGSAHIAGLKERISTIGGVTIDIPDKREKSGSWQTFVTEGGKVTNKIATVTIQ